MVKRFYLAASWDSGSGARRAAEGVEAASCGRWRCDRRWWETPAGEDDAVWANGDRRGVGLSDALVVLLDKPSTGGGMWYECGYADGLGKRVVVYNPHGVALKGFMSLRGLVGGSVEEVCRLLDKGV